MTSSIDRALGSLSQPDTASGDAVRDRAAQVLRPAGALQRMDEVAAWLGSWQRSAKPTILTPAEVVFVADHGVSAEGVSAYPAEVTASMLRALREGVATANVMTRTLGVQLEVVDVGVGVPSGNLLTEPALDEERFESCFRVGRDAVAALETDLLVLGEMGIANTTPASAVCASLFGGPAEDWTGRGTGIDEATRERKIAVVEQARGRISGIEDPFEVLRQVGGPELVAIAGAVLEARIRSIPVILDGFVVTAAVAPLYMARADSLDHCIAGHCSGEPGHRLVLEKLGKEPLLDLGLRLGEGSGALAALPLVQLAAACVTDVATFTEWGLER